MTTHTAVEMLNGKLRKIQTLIYSDGIISKRIFKKPGDVVPFDIIWLNPVQPKQLILCCE